MEWKDSDFWEVSVTVTLILLPKCWRYEGWRKAAQRPKARSLDPEWPQISGIYILQKQGPDCESRLLRHFQPQIRLWWKCARNFHRKWTFSTDLWTRRAFSIGNCWFPPNLKLLLSSAPYLALKIFCWHGKIFCIRFF